MKKYLIAFGAVLSLLSLSGCSSGDDFKDEAELISRTGVLNEQESGDANAGTHVLDVAVGEKTYLRSVNLNLSDVQYLGNRVTVVGVMNSEDNVLEVTGVSVLEVLVKKQEEAELSTYKNTDLGFEIAYYTNWELKEWQNSDVEFKNSETGQSFKISQSPYEYVPQISDEGTSDTPLEAFFVGKFPNQKFPGENKIGKDELAAFKMENEDYAVYYLYRNGLIYELTMLKVTGQNDLVYNEMLGSFRFVGFTAEDNLEADVADASVPEEEAVTALDGDDSETELTSFASLPYFFTASYPADWYYSGVNGGSDSNIRHHYGFSDESVTAENELIAMDVIVAIPSGGQKVTLGDVAATKFVEGERISFYLESEGQKYKVSGLKDYEEIIILMAKSIKPVNQ